MARYRAQYPATSARCGASSASWSRNNEHLEVANSCAICLEGMEKNLAALPCGHVFHHICVKEALSLRPTCPVCRRSTNNAIPLFLSFIAEAANRGSSSCTIPCCSASPAITASRLPEQLREMKIELDRVYEIQRMTSSHSFRLENDFVRRGQQLEQATRRMQQIQSELDNSNAMLKRYKHIVKTSYGQLNEVQRAKEEYERKVRSTADRMLEKIRERQYTRCPCCENEWTAMKRVALEFSTAISLTPRTSYCSRHGRHTTPRNMSRTSSRETLARAQRHDPVDYDF